MERLERIKKETKLHVAKVGNQYTFNNEVILSCYDFQYLIDIIEKQEQELESWRKEGMI